MQRLVHMWSRRPTNRKDPAPPPSIGLHGCGDQPNEGCVSPGKLAESCRFLNCHKSQQVLCDIERRETCAEYPSVSGTVLVKCVLLLYFNLYHTHAK